ncbi:hypothetical protein EC973_001196, partial [Apophysomyces ossiformis]
MHKYNTAIEDVPGEANASSVAPDIQENQDMETGISSEPAKDSPPPTLDMGTLPSGWDSGIFYNGGESAVSSFELVDNQDLRDLIDVYEDAEILGATTDTSYKGTFRLAVAVAPGFTAAAKAIYDEMSEEAEPILNKKYRALVLVSSAKMKLGPKNIKLTPAFTKDIQEALDMPGEDKSKQYDALQCVFQKYGFYYPTRIAFGAKLVFEIEPYSWLTNYSEESTEWSEEWSEGWSEEESEEESDNGIRFSAIGINRSISEEEQDRITQLAEQNLQRIVADDIMWSEGMDFNHCKEPKVVLRGKFRPLYDLLDKSTRRKVINIWETSREKSWIDSLYGVHVDMEPAKEPAIKMATDADIRYYPTGNLPITDKGDSISFPSKKWMAEPSFFTRSYFRRKVDEQLAKTDWADK